MEEISLIYLNLDRRVFRYRAGGYTHLKGIGRGLSKYLKISLLSWSSCKKNEKDFVSCNKDFSTAFFGSLLSLTFVLLTTRERNFLIRKCPASLVIFPLVKFARLLFLKRTIGILEVNGIAGDYSKHSWLKKGLALLLHRSSLRFFNVFYCVNESLAERLIDGFHIESSRVVVCRNGGFPSKVESYQVLSGERLESICLVYFGANQQHYDISGVLECCDSLISTLGIDIKVVLVGNGFELFRERYSFVESTGWLTLENLRSYLAGMDIKLFGLLPLVDSSNTAASDIEPIKTFDYASLALPVIHSEVCLASHLSKDCFISYTDLSDLAAVLVRLSEISQEEYFSMRTSSVRFSVSTSWEERLKPLAKLVN